MWMGIFRDYDDREGASIFLSVCQELAHSGHPKRMLRHEHDIRAAGDSAVCGNPARVTAHYLNDHYAVMRLSCRMQTIDRVSNDGDRGIKTESEICAVDVVVDGLWNSDES